MGWSKVTHSSSHHQNECELLQGKSLEKGIWVLLKKTFILSEFHRVSLCFLLSICFRQLIKGFSPSPTAGNGKPTGKPLLPTNGSNTSPAGDQPGQRDYSNQHWQICIFKDCNWGISSNAIMQIPRPWVAKARAQHTASLLKQTHADNAAARGQAQPGSRELLKRRKGTIIHQ